MEARMGVMCSLLRVPVNRRASHQDKLKAILMSIASFLVAPKFDCHQHTNDKRRHACDKWNPEEVNTKRKARVLGVSPVEPHKAEERGGTQTHQGLDK